MAGSSSRVAIIGAGVSGLVALTALRRAGHDAIIFEKTDRVGGQWNSVYDSVHLLSAKSATQFEGFPMPDDYPHFPSGQQFLRYIVDFAENSGLVSYIKFSAEVARLEPVDAGLGGWNVTVTGAPPEHFDAVVVANGHLVEPHVPASYPGTFSGRQLHTVEYRNASQLKGEALLVVGAGNSGCDMAIDGINAGKSVLFSVRTGTWFLPTTFFGKPRNEITFVVRLPGWLARRVDMWMTLVSIGRPESYGLPTPVEDNFNKVPPTISTLLPYWIQRGRIKVVPEIQRFDAEKVIFQDGSAEQVDTIIWATGYDVHLPFMPGGLITWIDGKPARKVGGLLSPDAANLYYSGLAAPRGGSPHNYGIGAKTIAHMVTAQRALSDPLSSSVFASEMWTGRMDYALGNWVRLLAEADEKLDKALAHARSRAAGGR